MKLTTVSFIIEFEKNIKKLANKDQLDIIPGALTLISKGKEYEIDFGITENTLKSATEVLSDNSEPIYVNEEIPDIFDFTNVKAQFTDFHIYMTRPKQVSKEKLKIKRIKKLTFHFKDEITKEQEKTNNPILEKSANKSLNTTIEDMDDEPIEEIDDE